MKLLKLLLVAVGLVASITEITQAVKRPREEQVERKQEEQADQHMRAQQAQERNLRAILRAIQQAIATAPAGTDLNGLDTFIQQFKSNTLPDTHSFGDFDDVAEELGITPTWDSFKDTVSKHCSICLGHSLLARFVETSCKHYAHPRCLINWVSGHNTCPTCGTRITSLTLLTHPVSQNPREQRQHQVDIENEQLRVNINSTITNRRNIDEVNEDGETLLHKAIRYNLRSEVRKLIDAGANVNARISHGTLKSWTPLHLAALFARTEISQILIDSHADINATTTNEDGIGNRGESVLHVAIRSSILNTVDVILAANPNLALRNAAGQTAYDLALQHFPLHYLDLLRP